jgi:ARG/rhodanese/phosphatase superfamily protein
VSGGAVRSASQGWEKGWRDVPDTTSSAPGAQEQGAVATAVRKLIGGVRQAEPLRAGALTLIPLMPAEGQTRQTGYLPLEEALRRNLVTITEQAQASVPELLAVSVADEPIVLVGGEQVVGGLQNRVLNTTILVAPHVELQIPVTCVEAGRWYDAPGDNVGLGEEPPAPVGEAVQRAEPAPRRAAKRAFSSDEAAYAQLRKLHAKSVTASLSAGAGHRSDQGAVWGEVAERMAYSRSYSPSSAMQALYKTPERAHKLKETVEALKRPEGALGFVALLNDAPLGAELFADEALASAYWDKLARSYAVEALDAEDRAPVEPSASGAEARLLEDALAADIQVHPSPGLGVDARLVSARVSGAGLVHEGVAVHLSLFPEDPASDAVRPQPARRHPGGIS